MHFQERGCFVEMLSKDGTVLSVAVPFMNPGRAL